MSTEEDGVDEAGPSTQPPLIMAPLVPKADPDELAEDTVVDNGIMAPSRTRTGSSHSGAAQRGNGANGSSGSNGNGSSGSSSNSASAATEALPVVKEAAEAKPATVAPPPADVVGKGKGRPSSGEETGAGQGTGRQQGNRQTMTSGESTDWAAAATVAEDAKPAAKSDRKPLFPRSEAPPAPSTSTSTRSYSGSSEWSPSYTRSEWSTEPQSRTAASAASSASAPPAPPVGPTTATPGTSTSHNGYSSGNGFSAGTVGAVAAGAATAATGAAAGLASSVSSAWQRRGSGSAPRGIQARKKANKRQAMLTLARVEPWSVMKFSFVASVVAFIILFVAVAVLYMVLSALGVFDSLQHTVSTMTSSQGSTGTNISHYFSASLILGYTAMLGALNIVLITAMCTVGSVIYNLIAKTIGGIEVTLRETD
jgi:hypothetical protein